MGYLIAVSEESGALTEVLGEIADNYELETEEKIKVLTTLLEPMMILLCLAYNVRGLAKYGY